MWRAINESLSDLCSSTFWDTNLTWNSSDPDFTPCFENTILAWFPCICLWFFLPLEVYYLRYTKSFEIPFNLYNISKLITIAILITSTITDIFNYIFFDESYASVYIYTPTIKFFTFCLFFGLTYANIKCGIRSSGVLFIFSFLLACCGAPQLRTELKSKYNLFDLINGSLDIHEIECYEAVAFVSYLIFYTTVLIILFLNCFADASPVSLTNRIDRNVCPENNSSFLSKILFSWFGTLARKGYEKPLENDDVWNLEDDMKSFHLANKFESKWCFAVDKLKKKSAFKSNTDVRFPNENEVLVENEVLLENENLETSDTTHGSTDTGIKEEASIILPLCKIFALYFMWGAVLKLFKSILSFLNPLILNWILQFIGNKKEFVWHGYFYAILLLVVGTAETLFFAYYAYLMLRMGLQIRTTLITVIYKKALKISNGARKNLAVGEVVNLMAVDAQRFVELLIYLNLLWDGPLEVIVPMYFLWKILGPSVLAGLAVLIVLIPINIFITSKVEKLQVKQMKYKDERIKMINEILSGIKVLKLYAWESSFEKRVVEIRDAEIKILKDTAYLNSCASFLWTCSPFLVSLVTFAVYVLSSDKNVLDAQTAFVSLSLFNILRHPMILIPMVITNYARATVSVKRINKFLNAEELDPSAVSHEKRDEAIVIENGQFSWQGYVESPALSDINVNVKSGNLIAVIGSVGAGKTSLLYAILGEMYKQRGCVNTSGRLAYVPQQAWIQNATFKNNITFGDTTNNSFYDRVIAACALKADLAMLVGGDQTEIGEKGINLSGGQKQRVSLARAVFLGADIYLLDDPLSAVDSHVGKHIFEQVIGPTGLLKGKTRVLVTHNITYLSQVDFIIVMKDGMISESGTYSELMANKTDFAEFLAIHSKGENNELKDEKDADEQEENPVAENVLRQRSKETTEEESPSRCEVNIKESEVLGDNLIDIEKIEIGNIKWKVYAQYLKAVGLFIVLVTISTTIYFQGFAVASNYWLSVWTSNTTSGHEDPARRNLYLGVYGLFGFGQAVSILIQTISAYVGMLRASNYAHRCLLTAVLHWLVIKFDTIPSGRVINRFSNDMEILDNRLPESVMYFLRYTALVISSLFVISYSTPLFLFVILPLAVIYYFVQRFYIATSRQLKRLESASRSPIYSHFSETISGVQTIRAYGLQSQFVRVTEDKIDFNQKIFYANVISNRWLMVRLEMMGNLVVFFAALFAVLGRNTLSTGLVGLSITYALQVTVALSLWVRIVSEVETNIVAVERIREYSEVEQEAAWVVPDEEVPQDWPSKGEILFDNLQVRYREGSPLILKGISFDVKGGEKIGIVGRTGAGKSSLTSSLFRIIESVGGTVTIDGVDISKIGLHTLRSRLTIIPQDPVLFSGTLRMNMDPMENYSDENIWTALELIGLKTYVSNLDEGLQHVVTEDGSNFSVGQRQLICLGRAVLRKTKVLILDEATAAIDLETDDRIQATIRKEFKDRTVLTIAHRLKTVLDYDRIIILDNGSVVEFDSPEILLKSKQSIFYKLAVDANLI